MSKSVEIQCQTKKQELLRTVSDTRLLPSVKLRPATLSAHTREELIKLVQRLFLSHDRGGPSVVVFSAVKPGSGCTWTCARIAELLADRADGLVSLIDANFRSPGLRQEFEFQSLEENAEEWTFAPVTTSESKEERSNLWLLSYNPPDKECPTSASLQRFQIRISDLRQDFRYVLIDAPPLNAYADAALFGRMADGVVMVVDANDTRRELAKKAKQMLDDSGVGVLGAVFNKRVFPIPEMLYRRL